MRNIFWKSMTAAVCATALTAPASATTTLAQFIQTFSSSRIFSYTNVNSGPVKAKFNTTGATNVFLASNLGTLISPTFAKVSLTATATSLPTLSGSAVTQLFSGTLAVTLLAPQMGLSGPSVNALTVNFTNGILVGDLGSGASALRANEDLGSSIIYVSDFADLSETRDEDFSLSFSGASVPFTMVGSRLVNFRTSGSGTFAANVPEPTTWGMTIGGFALIGAAMRRRRAAVTFA
jgi:hypothetical protein